MVKTNNKIAFINKIAIRNILFSTVPKTIYIGNAIIRYRGILEKVPVRLGIIMQNAQKTRYDKRIRLK